MEFDFREFCIGLKGLTEKEAGEEIIKKMEKLTYERNFGELSVSEKALNQDWSNQLREVYLKTDILSDEMFKLDEVIKRDF